MIGLSSSIRRVLFHVSRPPSHERQNNLGCGRQKCRTVRLFANWSKGRTAVQLSKDERGASRAIEPAAAEQMGWNRERNHVIVLIIA